MARPNRKRLIEHDLYAMPDDGQRHDLIRGRLVSEPPTGHRHGRIASILCCELEIYSRRSGQNIAAVCDVGFCLAYDPDTVRAPDVAVVATSRLSTFDDQRRFFPGAPDLAIEILSPSDRPPRVHEKITDYLDAGTSAVWVVDSDQQHVGIWTATDCHIREVLTAPDLMPGFALSVTKLF